MSSEASNSECTPLPVVLVMSECKATSPQTVVNGKLNHCSISPLINQSPIKFILDLRKLPESESQCTLENSLLGFKHSLSTKYYTTELALLPFNDPLISLPATIRETIEGLIVYFDAKDRLFLSKLEDYANFLEDNNIEFGILVCDHIYDDEKDGITYREAKQHSRVLDLIELNPETEEAGGYEEVHRAMNNTIWSNVVMNDAAAPKKKSESKDMTEHEMEEKLESFEKLLSQAMSFRVNTADMGRNERLLYAQQFADAFESVFGEESGDDDD